MSLTVTEKQHWKDRIARRIDKRIEAILALEPNLMERIQREARQRALQSLGLSAWQSEVDDVERQTEVLKKRSEQVLKLMLAHVRGVHFDDLEDTCYGYQREEEVRTATVKRQRIHEDELLAECETGREILRLRQEQENLLDIVWLATSPNQLKTLWSKVNELLSSQPSQLERDALAIPPLDVADL